jgi:hypothetical protein
LNVTLAALAASSTDPLMTELACDTPAIDGVPFGISTMTNTPVTFRRADPSLLAPHLAIVGKLGSGRTYAAKLELLRQIDGGAAATVIDTGGEYCGLFEPHDRHAPGDRHAVPLLIPATDVTVAAHMRTISPWLLSVSGLDPADLTFRDLLDRALGRAYERFGYGPGSTVPANAAAPDLDYVIGALSADDARWSTAPPGRDDQRARKSAQLHERLDSMFGENGNCRVFVGGRPTTRPRGCHDLHQVPDELLRAHLAILQLYATVCAQAATHDRLRIVVLEVNTVMLNTPVLRDTLNAIVREARKYKVALTLSLDSNDIGLGAARRLLVECSTTLILRCGPASVPALQSTLGLSFEQSNRVLSAAPGEGLLIIGNEHGTVNLRGSASADEEARLTADRPPLPDITVRLRTVEFPGYGSEPSHAWAVNDDYGNVLFTDAPDNPSTSVNNAEHQAFAAYVKLNGGVVPASAWVKNALDDIFELDVNTGRFAHPDPNGDLVSAHGANPHDLPFIRVALEELRCRVAALPGSPPQLGFADFCILGVTDGETSRTPRSARPW